MSEPVVSVRNLRKAFGSQGVLSDVSFELPAGKTLALLGRNGAGKTTALPIVSGSIVDLGEKIDNGIERGVF
jgi:ABC-type multidrug transport system ATPase subunit